MTDEAISKESSQIEPIQSETAEISSSIDEAESEISPPIKEESADQKEKALSDFNNELESQRESIKAKLGLDDESFDILIKETILASFSQSGARMKPDDPIFAVVLSQKNVMKYYTKIIADALKETPRAIGDVIDDRINSLIETAGKLGSGLDNFYDELLKGLQEKSLEVNNNLITSIDKFFEKKLTEVKKEIQSIEINASQPQKLAQNNAVEQVKAKFEEELKQASNKPKKSIQPVLLAFIVILMLLNLGLTGYSMQNKNAGIEERYQRGLIDGFQAVRKELPTKDADKVEKIIVDSIDKRLRGN